MASARTEDETTNTAGDALAQAEARYIKSHPNSLKQHELAVSSMPGGNTRTLLHTSPFPLNMKNGQGPYVWDEDGHKYTDFVAEATAGLFGHSHPVVREAMLSTFDNVGLSLGSSTAQEHKYASFLCDRFEVDRIRFTNSGTEATLHALGAARHFTGRRKVLVFHGAYHGAVVAFPTGVPAPNNVDRGEFLVAEYNDTDGACAAIAGAQDLAAVLVEPMQGAGGYIPGRVDFLQALHEAARAAGALFILDEVMTSRLAPHGLGSALGLKPDMKVMGKYLGGGFAFGAFGGRADIMAVYDPRMPGSIAHSGTFNNNTMAMHVGYAAMSRIYTEEACIRLNAQGDTVREKLVALAADTRMSVTGRGSMLAVHFTETGTTAALKGSAKEERTDLRDLFWFEMLEAGFWTTRRGQLALIIDTPEEELDRFVEAVRSFVERHASTLKVAGQKAK